MGVMKHKIFPAADMQLSQAQVRISNIPTRSDLLHLRFVKTLMITSSNERPVIC
jgi:hypothetical protein